ncbi:LLM class flavin-dependent oxidoreductase [Acuticoccus mangrovi]|uniref:LLM class flavin-dependent oxidoreductase n=1 Tax=Acuticoccus mangrovi TaxID=2796142 RepID=A0A934IGK6_9HYPH|nr:LLM class flavin-dependent oxidoreductase [Acuticoccus mangrovi]MBJ3776299.1 LLM class flavin-dependent oxidoreductase [Acuticoccus mangrovi]
MAPRFELGLFLPNTSGGTVMGATLPPDNLPTFATNRAIVARAEAAGFDFALSQVKWRGYGGPSRHWDYALESFTLTAALAATTSRMRLFASVAIRTIHPAVVAKMAATIDDVAPGRFGVNIVAGWNKFEYAQMGLWAEDDYYAHRYDYAAEYLEVMTRLWADGRVSHEGRFFTLEDCTSWPTPARRLPIVCAGQSDEAIAFTARQADYAFVGRMKDDIPALGALAGKIAEAAAAEGRTVGAYVLMTVIAADTDAAALARRDAYVAGADTEAIANWLGASGNDSHRAGHAAMPTLQRTFMGFHLVVGSHATVAAHLDALADTGVTGACLVFPDFAPDLDDFIDNVVPRLTRFTALP